MATNLANISIKDSTSWNTYLDLIYPVGAVYISFSNASPASLFGGTWGWIDDYFLRAGGNTNTGGSNTHTLTINEMPSHTHNLAYYTAEWTGGGQSCYRWTSDANGSWNPVSKATGGGQAHNNMPKYQNVFCWRRTA